MTSLPITYETTANTNAFCRALDEWVTSEYDGSLVGGMIAFDANHRVIDIRPYVILRSRVSAPETPHGDEAVARADLNEWIDDVNADYVMSFIRRPKLGVAYPAIASPADIHLYDTTGDEAEADGFTYRGHLIVTEFTEGLLAEPDDPRMIEARATGERMLDLDHPAVVDGHNPDDAGRAAIRRLEQRMFGGGQPTQGKAGQPTDLPPIKPDVPRAFYEN